MAEEETQTASVTHLVRYELTVEDLRAKVAEARATVFDAPEAERYELARRARAELRGVRVDVEKRRKALKAHSLEYGRAVDSVAKSLTAEIEPTEEEFSAIIHAVDEAKAKAKREAEEAERAEIERTIREAREAEEKRLAALREAEAARVKAEQEAEQARLDEIAKAQAIEAERLAALQREIDERTALARAEEQARAKAENERIAAEREALAAEERAQRERLAEEQRRLDAEAALLAAQKEAREREEFERQTRARLEAEAREQAERDRIAAEEARVREAERQAAHTARLEALKPDAEKFRAFAKVLRDLPRPAVASSEAKQELAVVNRALGNVVELLEDFAADGESKAAE